MRKETRRYERSADSPQVRAKHGILRKIQRAQNVLPLAHTSSTFELLTLHGETPHRRGSWFKSWTVEHKRCGMSSDNLNGTLPEKPPKFVKDQHALWPFSFRRYLASNAIDVALNGCVPIWALCAGVRRPSVLMPYLLVVACRSFLPVIEIASSACTLHTNHNWGGAKSPLSI